METIETHLDPKFDDFRRNASAQALVDEPDRRVAVARQGGGPKYVARHKEQGKAPPRAAIRSLARTSLLRILERQA